MRALPGFAAVRAFESTARLGSCKGAAAELHLTESAVSHQIKRLEADLDVVLFHRRHRALVLTEIGVALHAEVSRTLDQLAHAFAQVRRKGRRVLAISVLPGFAAHWLIPRLAGFYAANPAMELRLSSTERLVDFNVEEVDVAIRYGEGAWPGLSAELVLEERLAPVCTPEGLTRWVLRSPADVLAAPRIGNLQHPDEWADWARGHGLPSPSPVVMAVENSPLLMQAVAAGMGVGLGRSPVMDAELAAGRLVAAQPLQVSGKGYWLVHPRAAAGREAVDRFRRWLRVEARLKNS